MKEKKREKIQLQLNTPKSNKKQHWEKPSLEDVSGKIMAQPYIRFT